ncbi:hypothetical protein GCM10007890_39050 [Methylobacterium tardum]|uniref:Coenzyme PQQ synthesis protein A n=7 Tax=Methylobacterium TaxID=407 RepID=A0AA37WU56_9HYPH|nr:hypothetical protein GCM10007890_39050 [Methylobacterium tardum]
MSRGCVVRPRGKPVKPKPFPIPRLPTIRLTPRAGVTPRHQRAPRSGPRPYEKYKCCARLYCVQDIAYMHSATARRNAMAWSAPIVSEICVGMEVTSYESAEIDTFN